MPWITAPIHPYLRKAFDHMGEVRKLNPGDWLYPHVQVRSYMLVEAGLTGRIVATVDGQSGAGAMALSTP
ncbi:MAG: Crp/Fnr family transcriptional regulator, partial [Sutterella wadsworthensis]